MMTHRTANLVLLVHYYCAWRYGLDICLAQAPSRHYAEMTSSGWTSLLELVVGLAADDAVSLTE